MAPLPVPRRETRMRLETVAESWATYRAKVLPADASQVQVVETRRSFYAGVYFCLMNLAFNIGDDSTDEEEGLRELEKLKAECEAFAANDGMPLPHAEPPPPPPPPEPEQWAAPADRKMRPLMHQLGRHLAEFVPKGWGFTLLLFTFGEQGNVIYLSNANREDMMTSMRTFIRRQTQ
jgi:hypothetical protein